LREISSLYRALIDAENRHDIDAVGRFLWISPDALFVAKTATPAEGNWAGYWGTEVVLQHLDDLYKAGPFHIDPDYSKEKVVALSGDVAQSYVPVSITVAYAGQVPQPKPFLMILEWVRTPQGWRMATDIALPIPLSSHP
jgi:ketosteroid isomerase-like protein